MKTVKLVKAYYIALMAVATLFMVSCSEDNPNTPPMPDEQVNHYDLWVSMGKNAGGSRAETRLVKGVESLDKAQNVDFKGSGVDVSSQLFLASFIKDGFYYQVPKSKDRIGKYRIANGVVEVVKEVKFKKNTLKDRRYSHTWIDENTVVLFGADGKYQQILWIKLDTKEMKILAEGTLDIAAPSGKYAKLSTSGIANFRKADGKILYAYLYKTKGKIHREDHFLVAFINPKTMEIEKTIKEERAEFMAGTAYGELNQHKTFFANNGDYYIACNSVLADATSHTQQKGAIVRIKAGTTEFDKSYLGFDKPQGKIITVDYMRNNKALLYIEDPVKTGTDWSSKSFNCYYATLDLETNELKEIKLPYSQGLFSQRSVVVNDKAYIGVNPKDGQPAIYIYDINTEKAVKGLTIQEGISFDRIVKLNK